MDVVESYESILASCWIRNLSMEMNADLPAHHSYFLAYEIFIDFRELGGRS